MTLTVAEHPGEPEPTRQPADLGMDPRVKLLVRLLLFYLHHGGFPSLSLPRAAANCLGPSLG